MCCVVLADYGADVIKIEPPGRGERARGVAPFITAGDERVSGFFGTVNRNRRGITLDLKSDAGKAAFRALVAESDVVVENFSPGTMDGLGLGYDALRALNPRLVYVAISGFGQLEPYIGPWSTRPATNGRPVWPRAVRVIIASVSVPIAPAVSACVAAVVPIEPISAAARSTAATTAAAAAPTDENDEGPGQELKQLLPAQSKKDSAQRK